MRPSLGLLLFVTAGVMWGQSRPPVILIDGYHLLCKSGNLNSLQDFGELEQRLQSEGVKVAFFGTCSFSGRPSIEDMANALGTEIRNLNAPEVDLVSHSMGGLIVRAYLSGKQNAPGVFTPPLHTQVRKWVSIATPNFGALLPSVLLGFVPDQQTAELVPGGQFLFDLATWNQNHDDLRGVDAVGIIGNAGGFAPINGGQNDGLVAVTSASLSFTLSDERTRVLPYCHGSGDLTSILGLGCDAPPIARIQSDNPLSWTIIDSFFKGTADWQAVGHPPSQDKILSQYGGILSQPRNNLDQPTGPIQDQALVTNAPRRGGYSVVINKPGPQIASITPDQGSSPALSLAPGMPISISGSNLGGSAGTVNGQILVLDGPVAGASQFSAFLPDNIQGLVKLTVTNSQGSQTVNLFIVPSSELTFGSLSHLVVGGMWNTSFYLVGMGQTSANVRFSQFADSGNPLPTILNFPQQPNSAASVPASSIDRGVSPNSLLVVDSTGLDGAPVQTGSARLAVAGKVDGFAIFHYAPTGQEAAVPLETRNASAYVLAFDNQSGIATGVSIDNLSAQANDIAVTIRDDAGVQIGSDSIGLPGNGHTAFVLASQYPATANKRGVLEINTRLARQASALGIRFTPPGTLTTIPVLANLGASGGSIAHIASANGWKTTFVLVNMGATSAQAHLTFFDDSGNPLVLPLSFPQSGGNGTAVSSLNRTLAAQASLIVESQGPDLSPLQVGSAQLTSDGQVSGFVIFRYTPTGQEAVVPLESRNANSYVLAFDNTNLIATGVALNTVSSRNVNVPVVIRDNKGNSIDGGSITLNANGHASFVLATQYPATAGLRGTIEFTTPTSAQISVLGIRSPPVLTFTTLPALAK